MHSAHNGTDYGSIPCGLNLIIYKLIFISFNDSPNVFIYFFNKLGSKDGRVLGRVWFMALVLKTSTFSKVVSSNLTVPGIIKLLVKLFVLVTI